MPARVLLISPAGAEVPPFPASADLVVLHATLAGAPSALSPLVTEVDALLLYLVPGAPLGFPAVACLAAAYPGTAVLTLGQALPQEEFLALVRSGVQDHLTPEELARPELGRRILAARERQRRASGAGGAGDPAGAALDQGLDRGLDRGPGAPLPWSPSLVPAPLAVIDRHFVIQRANQAFWERLAPLVDRVEGAKCYEVVHGLDAPPPQCPHFTCLASGVMQTAEMPLPRLRGSFQIIDAPIFATPGQVVGTVHLLVDITEFKKAEEARLEEIISLRNVLEGVQKLSNFITLCANCKKVRDESGQWQMIESYIRRHTGVRFSHGLCPACSAELYPDLWDDNDHLKPFGSR
ncbi:MAG: PAS domain-containing protein [Deltaproteobacteria bacterium]|nr:PAS domain-containing protein [Deltaproteobacteria bacterium]